MKLAHADYQSAAGCHPAPHGRLGHALTVCLANLKARPIKQDEQQRNELPFRAPHLRVQICLCDAKSGAIGVALHRLMQRGERLRGLACRV